MAIFAAAPFLRLVLGPIIGEFVSEYVKPILEIPNGGSKLEVDFLVVSDICLFHHGRFHNFCSRDVHESTSQRKSPMITKRDRQ